MRAFRAALAAGGLTMDLLKGLSLYLCLLSILFGVILASAVVLLT